VKLHELSPEKLVATCKQFRELSDDARPEEIKEECPASIAHYRGSTDFGTKDKPEFGVNVNWLAAAWSAFKSHLIGRCPKPASVPPKRAANKLYAPCANEIQAYADDKFDHEIVYEQVVEDAFFRGTGASIQRWDSRFGVARSEYFNPRLLYPDASATSWGACGHVIEAHECRREEVARKYGVKVAGALKAIDEGKSPVAVDTEQMIEDKNPLDMVRYYVCWSKHDEENRCLQFADEYQEDYFWTNPVDGLPGDPFPFPMADESWPFAVLPFNRENNKLWGQSYYKVSEGPLKGMAWAYAFMMQAGSKSSKQAMAYPRNMEELIQEFSQMTTHMGRIAYDDEGMVNGQKIKDLIEILEFPALPQTLLDMFERSKQVYEDISGYNAAGQVAPQGVETAGEMQGMMQAAANKLAYYQAPVEQYFKEASRIRHRINADKCTLDAVVKVRREGAPTAASDYGDEDVTNPAEPRKVVPFEQAVALTKAIPKKDVAELSSLAAFNAAVGAPGVPEHPEADLRVKLGVPLDATIEIEQAGVRHLAGEELAAGWIEGATDWEIEANIEIDIESGSSSEMAQQNRQTKMERIAPLLAGTLQQFQAIPQLVDLHNALVDSTEEDALQGCKLDVKQVMATVQQQQQAEQQALQVQQQQAGAEEAQAIAAAESRTAVAEARLNEQAAKNDGQRIANDGLKIKQQTAAIEGEERRIRDRSRSELQLRS